MTITRSDVEFVNSHHYYEYLNKCIEDNKHCLILWYFRFTVAFYHILQFTQDKILKSICVLSLAIYDTFMEFFNK